MEQLRENMWHERRRFSFDHNADRLVEFFRTVIASRGRSRPTRQRRLVGQKAGAD
jgi:hypothetical protein